MSDTPRTDKRIKIEKKTGTSWQLISADFARELERENAELLKLVGQMEKALQNIVQVVTKSEEIPWLYDGDCGAIALFGQIDDMCKAALEAAKGGK